MSHDPNEHMSEMKRLVERACEGALTRDEAARLDELVCSNTQAAWFYARYMAMHAMLERYERHAMEGPTELHKTDGHGEVTESSAVFAQLAALEAGSEVAQIVDITAEMDRREQHKRSQARQSRQQTQPGGAISGHYSFDPTPVRHYVIPKIALYGGLAAVIAVAAAIFWPEKPTTPNGIAPTPPVAQVEPVARLAKASSAVWDERFTVPNIGDDLMPGQLHLRQGRVKLIFSMGAEAYFEGPAVIDLKRDDRMTMTSGAGSFHVPPRAVGFEVLTDGARVVDLGTDFAVSVKENRVSEVHVFTGKVRASLLGPGFVDMAADTAQRIDAAAGTFAPIEPDDFLFVNSWQALNRRVRVTGDVQRYEEQVVSLEEFGLITDLPVLIREQEGVVLPRIAVGYTEPGRHPVDEPREVMVRRRTKVDSYLWHWKRPGEPEDREVVRVQGSMRFPRPIVGVITNFDQMIATDEVCGLPGVPYCQETYRQMDNEASQPIYLDYLTISEDRHTVEFDISLKGYDEFRVLIEAAKDDQIDQ